MKTLPGSPAAALALGVIFSFAPAHLAWAQKTAKTRETPADLVTQAKILYEELEYEAAFAKLETAIKSGELARTDAITAYELMGFIYLMQDKLDLARASFQLLLRLDPDHRLDATSAAPKFVTFFEQVRTDEGRPQGLALQHEPPGSLRAGEPIEITARVTGAGKPVGKLNLYWKLQDGPGFSTIGMERDPDDASRWHAVVPWIFGERAESFTLVYYLAALSTGGDWLATEGSPTEPMALLIEVHGGPYKPEEPPGLTSQWWFWTALGGVVAAGAGGAFLAVQLAPEPPEHGAATVVIR